MQTIQTEILIIGGGATGTGLVRDLAMRGFKTILVERGDLATGTTGRYHGLLHSGGRYAVKDPLAAKECITENKILKRIMPECIEDTGGLFVLTPDDDPAYVELFQQGCVHAGIPCDEISISQVHRAEPLLSPKITRAFRVPDASADSFLAADQNAQSASEYGAKILRYHNVQQLLTTGNDPRLAAKKRNAQSQTAVCGALCHDLVKDEDVRIEADLVINAAGAWVGKIAASAGILVQMTPGKGILMATNHRVVNTVINRCKMPGDGDIIVPAHTVAVIGTTDVKVADPDRFGIDPWEVQLMLDEGEKLIPGFHRMRFLRAWSGVRPLYQENKSKLPTGESSDRDITRAFVILDHTKRDSVDGFITITGGKWTTYRKMAEVTADKACEKLGVQRDCRTHLEPLPGGKDQKSRGHFHILGHRLAEVEASKAYGDLICECELSTRKDIIQAIQAGSIQTLDDIRRDIRLGMGPCQAGFCTLRAAGMLLQLTLNRTNASDTHVEINPHENAPSSKITDINVALRDFLQERWKGARPVLWGQQLRQERLNELVYIDVLNADHLSGPKESRLKPGMYIQEPSASVSAVDSPDDRTQSTFSPLPEPGNPLRQADILVIGAGLAGLTAALIASLSGYKVNVIAKGWGATYWSSGCFDLLGYYPTGQTDPVVSPINTLEQLIRDHPRHPYATTGIGTITMAMRNITEHFDQAGYPLHGSLDKNWLLPTALGTFRPTCLAPATMVAGDLNKPGPMLIVGFQQYLDFYPDLIAENISSQGIHAQGLVLDLPMLKSHKFLNSMTLARLFDQPDFRAEVVKAIKSRDANAARIGFPAVLGLQHPMEVSNDLQTSLGSDVFEIPGLPPSVPGIRLHNILKEAIQRHGGLIYEGFQVSGAHAQGDSLQAVLTDANTRQVVHRAKRFILATGGILGGGISVSPPGFTQNPATETALGLPVRLPPDRTTWLHPVFLGQESHLIFKQGFRINSKYQPIDDNEMPYFENLQIIGGSLGDCDPVRERSLEGIAISTAYAAINRNLAHENQKDHNPNQTAAPGRDNS